MLMLSWKDGVDLYSVDSDDSFLVAFSSLAL